jgi:HEAT repeat protein
MLRLLVLCSFLLPTLAAQKPRTADEALRRLEEVQDADERQRQRPVRDLGEFPEPAVAAALLRELERATDAGYRQTVLRAIGRHARPGAAKALRRVLETADNARLCDSAAEALANQGDEGVDALAGVLAQEKSGGMRRTAACDGLGRTGSPRARALLIEEVRRAANRDRLPPLRALARQKDDAELDELRLQLVLDKDSLVATTALGQLAALGDARAVPAAQALQKRLGNDATGEQFAAVLDGLLIAVDANGFEGLLVAAARAEGAFDDARLERWRAAIATPGFVAWLAKDGIGRKIAIERIAAARALALAPSATAESAVAGLVKLLQDRDADVVRAAAFGLVAHGAERATPPLTALLQKANETTIAAALGALHALRSGDAEWQATLAAHAEHKSPAARAAALSLLRQPLPADADAILALATKNLDHKAWPVRAAAIDLLLATRSKQAPPLLFERLDAESARLQQDLLQALEDLTGYRFPVVAQWRDWWQKEGPTFTPRPTKARDDKKPGAAGTAATYFDLPVYSDRVAFVVDTSGSMLQPFGTGGRTRLDEAKRQLQRVLEALPAKAKANIVAFAFDAEALGDRLQVIDAKRRKSADAWIEALTARGPTNVFAALQRAFADPEVDTIFVLTDGRPSSGTIVEAKALADEVQRWNTGRGIRIHTVALGGASDFLERLARDSGGEHVVAR